MAASRFPRTIRNHEKRVLRQLDAEQHNFGLLAVRPECLVADSGRACNGLFHASYLDRGACGRDILIPIYEPNSAFLSIDRLLRCGDGGNARSSTEDVDGRCPRKSLRSDDRGLSARYRMPHAKPRWRRNSLEREVREGMREGRLADRYSHEGWRVVFAN